MSIVNRSLIKKGLIFGYDTDVKSSRFYKGEPTTNLVTNGDFSSGKTGWDLIGNVDSYTSVGKYLGKNCIYAIGLQNYNQTPGYFGQQTTISGGQTYTISFDYFIISGKIMFDLNNAYNIDEYLTTVGEWVKYSTTFVSLSTNLEINFYGEIDTPSYYYITNVQVESNNHSTKFVNGARTSYESLIDLTEKITIDLYNVSFDNNSQIIFDGIYNYIQLGLFTILSDFTISLVFKDNGSNQLSNILNINNFYLTTYGDSSPNTCGGGFINSGTEIYLPYEPNKYHFLTSVRENNIHKIYIDGVENSNSNYIPTEYIDCNTNPVNISYNNNSYDLYKGSLPLLYIYDRALKQDEILNNFNSIKKRFSI